MGPVREDGWGRSRKGAPVNREERRGAGGDTKGKRRKTGGERAPRSVIIVIFKKSLHKLSALWSF